MYWMMVIIQNENIYSMQIVTHALFSKMFSGQYVKHLWKLALLVANMVLLYVFFNILSPKLVITQEPDYIISECKSILYENILCTNFIQVSYF